MIPKVLHYIWLGGEKKPSLCQICVNSWKEKLPDYKIIEWNESNLELNKIALDNRFFKECMKRKLWAFMSDYLRLKILYEYGGVYLDTDVQVLSNFDEVLTNEAFIGLEVDKSHNTSVFGCVKNNIVIGLIKQFYEDSIWHKDIYTIPSICSYILKNNRNLLDKITIYPAEMFSPIDYKVGYREADILPNTKTIHWYLGSWLSNNEVNIFLQTKHIQNPLMRKLVVVKKRLGIFKRKLFKLNRKIC